MRHQHSKSNVHTPPTGVYFVEGVSLCILALSATVEYNKKERLNREDMCIFIIIGQTLLSVHQITKTLHLLQLVLRRYFLIRFHYFFQCLKTYFLQAKPFSRCNTLFSILHISHVSIYYILSSTSSMPLPLA